MKRFVGSLAVVVLLVAMSTPAGAVSVRWARDAGTSVDGAADRTARSTRRASIRTA